MYITEETFHNLWKRRLETECSKALFTYWNEENAGELLLIEKYNEFCTVDVVAKLELGLKSGYIETINMEDGGSTLNTGSLTLSLCNRKWCFVRLI